MNRSDTKAGVAAGVTKAGVHRSDTRGRVGRRWAAQQRPGPAAHVASLPRPPRLPFPTAAGSTTEAGSSTWRGRLRSLQPWGSPPSGCRPSLVGAPLRAAAADVVAGPAAVDPVDAAAAQHAAWRNMLSMASVCGPNTHDVCSRRSPSGGGSRTRASPALPMFHRPTVFCLLLQTLCRSRATCHVTCTISIPATALRATSYSECQHAALASAAFSATAAAYRGSMLASFHAVLQFRISKPDHTGLLIAALIKSCAAAAAPPPA